MRVRLDRVGDAVPSPEEQLASTQVEWLRAAQGDTAILVRGESLCDWAERFCAWRGIPCEEASSPTKRLQEALQVDREWARAVIAQIGAALPEPLTATTLLATLAPHPTLWREPPSLQHAARWLLWLSQQEEHSQLAPLFERASRDWQELAPASVRGYYEAACPKAARTLLAEWLGIASSQRAFEPFPITPPDDWLQKAKELWKQQLVETNGDAWRSLWNRPLHPSVRLCLARTLSDFFVSRPDKLTAATLETMQSHLDADVYRRLRSLIAPEIPDAPPAEPDALIDWFANQYLPYREWQHFTDNQDARQEVNRLARLFAERLLEYYPQAILRSDAHLAFVQVARLTSNSDNRDSITLVVILDGMAHWDARELKQTIRKELPELHLTDSRLVFAALPTLTEFCKNALLTASPPRHALNGEAAAVGVIIPDQENPAEVMREAACGSLFFWRVAEPDQTYHKRNQDKLLSESVRAELDAVAQKLKRVLSELPDDYPLRLVITSDHGRLMGRAARQLTPPAGWQARERAAYSSEGEGRRYESHGYAIEGDLVYLSPVAFGLPCDVACVLSDVAFLDSAGKGGTVAYPHGGLYPEEVIIDWLVYARQPQPVQVQVTLRGKGRARQPAALTIEVRNLSPIALTLVGLQEQTGHVSIAAPHTRLPAYSTTSLEVHVDAFPDTTRSLQLYALFRTPDEALHQVPVETQLEVETMYQTEPILEDLL